MPFAGDARMDEHESNWTNASSRAPRELVQTIGIVLEIVRELYTETGSWPTVDQILHRLARP